MAKIKEDQLNKITNQQAKDEMFKKFTTLIKLWKRKNKK